MIENALSDAIGVDLTPPQERIVVDLTSVYRINVTSSDNTVAIYEGQDLSDRGR